ncbi:MAG TPA: hypothetical protein PLY05_10220 [Agitococcus sp.]|nr:hypothetical protein [Agitococcus sp.]
MNNKNIFKKTLIASALSVALTPIIALADMAELSDSEMSDEVGQALLSMGYTAPSGSGTGVTTSDYAYYKLGLEAKMEINLNIRNLQLGCGGRNGPGACDIDIENLSLSGPADGKTTDLGTPANNGIPLWTTAGGRPNSSAVLTNPFVEFAIKNPNTAATREIVGFRLSAEEILGHMSAGTVNDNVGGFSTGGGIKSFSGYLKVGNTPVKAATQEAIFGTTPDQAIYGKITSLGNARTVHANVNKMTPGAPGFTAPGNSNANFVTSPLTGNKMWGIKVPSVAVNFDFPQTSVVGNRMSQLNLVVRDVPVGNTINGAPNDGFGRIAIGRDSGGISMVLDEDILGLVGTATFFMGANNASGTVAACGASYSAANCSYISNLKANVTVKQNFNLVHNLPISSGGYLSLQREALRWPGSASAFKYDLTTKAITNVADNYVASPTELFNAGDIAQPGWWLSFKDPLDFGALNPTTNIPMNDVLPQIATFITDYLSNNNIAVGVGDSLGALFGSPLYKGLGDITLASNARAVMVLQNLLLDGNQQPVSNCWGGLKFC